MDGRLICNCGAADKNSPIILCNGCHRIHHCCALGLKRDWSQSSSAKTLSFNFICNNCVQLFCGENSLIKKYEKVLNDGIKELLNKNEEVTSAIKECKTNYGSMSDEIDRKSSVIEDMVKKFDARLKVAPTAQCSHPVFNFDEIIQHMDNKLSAFESRILQQLNEKYDGKTDVSKLNDSDVFCSGFGIGADERLNRIEESLTNLQNFFEKMDVFEERKINTTNLSDEMSMTRMPLVQNLTDSITDTVDLTTVKNYSTTPQPSTSKPSADPCGYVPEETIDLITQSTSNKKSSSTNLSFADVVRSPAIPSTSKTNNNSNKVKKNVRFETKKNSNWKLKDCGKRYELEYIGKKRQNHSNTRQFQPPSNLNHEKRSLLYITNTPTSMNEGEILYYLKNNFQITDATCHLVVPYNKKRSELKYLNFKISVSNTAAKMLCGKNSWPNGVRCRKWLTGSERSKGLINVNNHNSPPSHFRKNRQFY